MRRKIVECLPAIVAGATWHEYEGKRNVFVSSTLTDPAWHGTSVVSGDLRDAVTDLAASGEGDLLVAGSAKLVQGLLEAGLVDELRLATYPLVLGIGKRLFPLGVRLDFELAEAATTRTGVTLTTYRRPSGDGPGGDLHPFADR